MKTRTTRVATGLVTLALLLAASPATARETVVLFLVGDPTPRLTKAEAQVAARFDADGRFDLKRWADVELTQKTRADALQVATERRARLRADAAKLVEDGHAMIDAFNVAGAGKAFTSALQKYRLSFESEQDIDSVVALHLARIDLALSMGRAGDVQREFEAILAIRPTFALDASTARPSMVAALERAREVIANVRPFSTIVVSKPSGATVRLDGRSVGVTPLTLEDVPPGVHYITAELDGHLLWSQAEELNPERTEAVTAPLIYLDGSSVAALQKSLHDLAGIEGNLSLAEAAAGDLSASMLLLVGADPGGLQLRVYDARQRLLSDPYTAARPGPPLEASIDELLGVLTPAGLPPQAQRVIIERRGDEAAVDSPEWYQRWWVWAVAGVVIAGAGIGIAYSIERVNPPPDGYQVGVVLP